MFPLSGFNVRLIATSASKPLRSGRLAKFINAPFHLLDRIGRYLRRQHANFLGLRRQHTELLAPKGRLHPNDVGEILGAR